MERVSRVGYLGNTDTLSMEDVPDYLKKYVSDDALEEYNDGLPDESEVTEYNHKMFYCHTVKDNGIILRIEIDNVGSIKATDIHVEFNLPDSFVAIEKNAGIDLKYPRMPKMPKNPIDEAEMKYEHCDIRFTAADPLREYVSTLGDTMTFMPFSNDSALPSARMMETLREINGSWDVSAKNHSANVWVKELLHTKRWNRGEFCIAPMKAGDFIMRISIICEEMPEPTEMEYKIKVVEINV